MKGWKIFVFAVQMLLQNFAVAVRVSAVPYVVQVGAMLAFVGLTMFSPQAEQAALIEAGQFPWLGFVAVIVVASVTGAWIAVGWHRFVLAGEQPRVVPAFHGERTFAYLGIGLFIGLVASLAAVMMFGTIMLFAHLVPGPGGWAAVVAMMVLSFLTVALVVIICLRLGATLPGVALREGVPFGTGWDATRGETWNILALAIIFGVLHVAATKIGEKVFGGNIVLGASWQFVMQWAVLMISLSILTTLYGHYVEKRPLA
ncbi:MAG: hypothetical protein JSS08_10960 [Proteobacteria bacterium]|nr:hypothetical protein [Pseudomonadota bacterium]